MQTVSLNERTEYLPAQKDPLCCDIGVIYGERYTWIYDVGYGSIAASFLRSLPGEKRFVLSHFHEDHVGNLFHYGEDCGLMPPAIGDVRDEDLFVGSYTYRKFGRGTCVTEPITLGDGAGIRIFPFPSYHAKGCLAMESADGFVFLGDAVYPKDSGEQGIYNRSVITEQIRLLEELEAGKVLISHDRAYVMDKRAVLLFLRSLLKKGDPSSPFIIA